MLLEIVIPGVQYQPQNTILRCWLQYYLRQHRKHCREQKTPVFQALRAQEEGPLVRENCWGYNVRNVSYRHIDMGARIVGYEWPQFGNFNLWVPGSSSHLTVPLRTPEAKWLHEAPAPPHYRKNHWLKICATLRCVPCRRQTLYACWSGIFTKSHHAAAPHQKSSHSSTSLSTDPLQCSRKHLAKHCWTFSKVQVHEDSLYTSLIWCLLWRTAPYSYTMIVFPLPHSSTVSLFMV